KSRLAAPGSPGQVVATFNGNASVTREELGEYLIARYGADQLELLVNRRIIDQACRDKGVEVTAAEVEAALAQDLKGMQAANSKEFETKVLKPYHKTLY